MWLYVTIEDHPRGTDASSRVTVDLLTMSTLTLTLCHVTTNRNPNLKQWAWPK